MMSWVLYVIGILIMFLIRQYVKSSYRGSIMQAIYISWVMVEAFRFSEYLFVDKPWWVTGISTGMLCGVALLILKGMVILATRLNKSHS